MDKVKKLSKKILRTIGKCIKKIMNIKIFNISLLIVIAGIIGLLVVVKIFSGVVKGDQVDYPVVFNTKDGDLVLMDKKAKNEDKSIKLSNNDNTDNVKYANTTDRFILFKKSDSLHLYDSKHKDSTTKIISNVYNYYFTPLDKYVIALDKDSNLYAYKLGSKKDAFKIDKDVSSIIDFNDKYVLYISDNNLYIKVYKEKADRRKVSGDFNTNYVNQTKITEDGKKIVYIDKDNNLIVQKMNGKEEKVASNVTSFNTNKNASKMYYEASDEVSALYYYDGRSHKIDESIYRVFEVDLDNEMIVYAKLKDGLYSLHYAKGNKDSVVVQKDMDFIYSAMIFKNKSIYYVTDNNELRYAQITGNKVKKSKSVIDQVSISSVKEYKDGVYYVADVDDEGGTLYKSTAAKPRKLDTNVVYANTVVGMDGKKLYYFKNYENKGGELYVYNGRKSKLIDTEVYSFNYVNKGYLYYIKDYSVTNSSGDLYRYTGKSVKIATDVKKVTGINYIYQNK